MRPIDCHAGPGTTEPGCGACITCLHRVLQGVEAERDAAQAERDAAQAELAQLRQRLERERQETAALVAMLEAALDPRPSGETA